MVAISHAWSSVSSVQSVRVRVPDWEIKQIKKSIMWLQRLAPNWFRRLRKKQSIKFRELKSVVSKGIAWCFNIELWSTFLTHHFEAEKQKISNERRIVNRFVKWRESTAPTQRGAQSVEGLKLTKTAVGKNQAKFWWLKTQTMMKIWDQLTTRAGYHVLVTWTTADPVLMLG